MLKAIGLLSLALLLSACGTTARVHRTSFYGYGPSVGAHDPYQLPPGLIDRRLLDAHFYMDEDTTPRWLLLTEPRNR